MSMENHHSKRIPSLVTKLAICHSDIRLPSGVFIIPNGFFMGFYSLIKANVEMAQYLRMKWPPVLQWFQCGDGHVLGAIFSDKARWEKIPTQYIYIYTYTYTYVYVPIFGVLQIGMRHEKLFFLSRTSKTELLKSERLRHQDRGIPIKDCWYPLVNQHSYMELINIFSR